MTGSGIPERLAEDETAAGLALLRMPKFDRASAEQLLQRFGSFRDSLSAGTGLGTLPDALHTALRHPEWDRVEQDLRWLEGGPRTLVWWHEPAYPAPLREIPDAPPALFVEGDPGVLQEPMVAVVGSRHPTRGGRDTAHELGRSLAEAGVTVASGLAAGIDGAAHAGALERGRTLAVSGNGLDRVYPARHRDLARQIATQGALVSELPPGTPPRRHHFPRRNRIIAGLSLGTLVVEAAEKSGSLITARLAGDFGREVFAVPGSVHNPVARGCHRLIREGAKLVETVHDILEEILVPAPPPSPAGGEASEREADLDAVGRRVLEAVDFAPTPIDRIVEQSGLTVQEVSSMLISLEIQGRVTREPGARFARAGVRRS